MGLFRRALDSGKDYLDIMSGAKSKRLRGAADTAAEFSADSKRQFDKHKAKADSALEAAEKALRDSYLRRDKAKAAHAKWKNNLSGDQILREDNEHLDNVKKARKAAKAAEAHWSRVFDEGRAESSRLHKIYNDSVPAAEAAASAAADALQQQTKYRRNTAIGAAGLTAAGVGGTALYNRGQEKTAMYLDILSTHPLWRN